MRFWGFLITFRYMTLTWVLCSVNATNVKSQRCRHMGMGLGVTPFAYLLCSRAQNKHIKIRVIAGRLIIQAILFLPTFAGIYSRLECIFQNKTLISVHGFATTHQRFPMQCEANKQGKLRVFLAKLRFSFSWSFPWP